MYKTDDERVYRNRFNPFTVYNPFEYSFIVFNF